MSLYMYIAMVYAENRIDGKSNNNHRNFNVIHSEI